MKVVAWLQLRLRARRFGRLRQYALIDWWLGEIRAVSGPEPRREHRCEYSDPVMCAWPGHRR